MNLREISTHHRSGRSDRIEADGDEHGRTDDDQDGRDVGESLEQDTRHGGPECTGQADA